MAGPIVGRSNHKPEPREKPKGKLKAKPEPTSLPQTNLRRKNLWQLIPLIRSRSSDAAF